MIPLLLLVAAEILLFIHFSRTATDEIIMVKTLLSSYHPALQASHQSQNRIRFQVISEELMRKVFKYPTVDSIILQSLDGTILFQTNPIFNNSRLNEAIIPHEGFVWSIKYHQPTIESWVIMLKTALAGTLLWAGIMIMIGLQSPQKAIPVEKTASEPDPAPGLTPHAPDTPNFTAPSHVQAIQPQIQAELPATTKPEEFLYRLENEIKRCAEFAIDLSLCLVQYPSRVSLDDSRKTIIEEFIHEDLIFLLPKNVFAIILPHHDLDQSMARTELFMRKSDKNIPDSHEMTSGLSSRSGRLIDAKRLYKESMISLKKASIKQGRLVGFRADPTRYRNYLTHQKIV